MKYKINVGIEVRQDIKNGVVSEKKYSLRLAKEPLPLFTDTPVYVPAFTTGSYLFDLSEADIKELIPRLTQELEKALQVKDI